MRHSEYKRGYLDGVLAASMHFAKDADRHGRRLRKAGRLLRLLRALGRDTAKADWLFSRALDARCECVRAMLALRPVEDAARADRTGRAA